MRRLLFIPLVAFIAGLLVSPAQAAPAPVACDPIQTQPSFRGEAPPAAGALGFPLGSREVTAAEANTYLLAVDAASPRVISGTVATSWQGRTLHYALVGNPSNLTRRRLAAIREATAALMDPTTSTAEAAAIASRTPATLWLAGNVHGNEESGTDSELRILYELADRDDCAARQILDNALVVIVPTQNPDGREAETRENFYGFDMNRDWFARSQREIDGQVELLRQYPGQLFVDAHEMGSTEYFFPPNQDPIYHEHTDFTVELTDNLYGPAMAAEFDRQGIPYWQNAVFDFFAPVYGDTVPSHISGAVGMTFEKHNGDPISRRTYEHYVTQWVSLSQGALNRQEILQRWHSEWVKAYEEGVAGELQPNEVNDPGNAVTRPVPNEPVRHYFLRADDAAKAAELQRLIRRLQRTDVAVYRLTAPLAVPDYKEYGRERGAAVLPAGTYWIPMAQSRKHWVQALLNEDTYVPFPYFYDVSGWSNPLLLNLRGGRSGAVLSPSAIPAPLVSQPDEPALPTELPRVAVYQLSPTATSARQSTGWLRYLLEQRWNLPYEELTSAQIAAGGLAGVDVLLVANGPANTGYNALGATGRQALVDWVNAGGRFVGWRRGGAVLAARLGITTAQLREPTSEVAGALLRVLVDAGSPVGSGVGPSNWVYYEFDLVMTASNPAHVAAAYPEASSSDFFLSGYGEGQEELGGTAAVVDEPVGAGRAVIFSVEPNFRAWTEGTQRFLWNAIFRSEPPATAAAAGSLARADEEAASKASTRTLTTLESPIRISVEAADERATERLLARYGARYEVRRSPGKVSFLVRNPRGLDIEGHPFAARLAEDLLASGLDVIAFKTP